MNGIINPIQDIVEQYQSLDRSPKTLRKTGLVFCVSLATLAALGCCKGWWNWPSFAVAAAVGALAWLRPAWLLLPYNGWMLLALSMGWMVSRLLLTLIYFLVVTPIGLIMRAMGNDPLDIKLGNRDSYWHELPEKDYNPADTDRMY